MQNKNKGLADNQDGEFILNESGTSVNTDNVEIERKREDNSIDDDNKPEKDSEKLPSKGDEKWVVSQFEIQ